MSNQLIRMPKIRANVGGTPRSVSYEDGTRVDLTWMYPPLERGVALDWTGRELAQFERSSGVGAPWQCTRAFRLDDSHDSYDLLALWLTDGALSWVAAWVDTPAHNAVPEYLVHVNNRGAARGSRPQLRHARWIAVSGRYPWTDFVSEDAQGAEATGWAAILAPPD